MSLRLVARRMEDIPFAGIRRVFEKASRLESRGVKVIHFEIGRPDFDTPAHIKAAAVQALNAGMVHYTPNAGIAKLREALAESLLQYKDVRYDPATEVMVTAGGQQAMYLSLKALLEPGDEVLVPDPGYSQFFSCIRLLDGVAVPMPLLAEANFCPDLAAVEDLVTERTRAIILNSPHNPTGGVLNREQVEAVCRFACEHNLLVLSDEAYDRILYDDGDFISPASLPGMKERTLIWGSLSKTYSMTGWRVGYLAAPADAITAAVKVQQNLMLSICSFAQAGAVAALRGPQECVQAMVAEFDRRRKLILDAIAQSPGLSCPTTPRGAFYVFAKHQVAGMDSTALADHLLEEGGVAVVPGPPFGTRGEGYLRISYATSLSDCREGMQRIARLMNELHDRS